MNAEDSLKLARRFIELPQEKRRLFLKALDKEGVDFSLLPIPAGVAVPDRQALSYAQQRMWFLWQLDPQSAAYNLPNAVRLSGPLDRAVLAQAFDWLLERHESLRTIFALEDDEPRQVIQEARVDIDYRDLCDLDPAQRETRVQQLADAEARRPFDLQQGPLLRVCVLGLGEQEHVMLLTLHHIVADGWSMGVLIEEFLHAYDNLLQGEVPNVPALPIQYRDYALWQRSWLEAGEQERQLDYWQAKLGDQHPPLKLPTDHPRSAHSSRQGRRLDFALEQPLAQQLGALARQQGVTLFAVLLAGFKLLLSRYSGQQDIRVGVPIANRTREEAEGLIGFFVNTQVLRTELSPQWTVPQLLADIRETTLGAQAHQDLPFERLVEALHLERSLSHSPLFQVLYNHQPQVTELTTLHSRSGLQVQALPRNERTVQFDLTLDTFERGGQLQAAFTYDCQLFEAQTIERMAGHWQNLLWAMVREPQAAIGELPLLSAEQRQGTLAQGVGPREVFAAESVLELFARQVAAQAEAPALVFAGQCLSYGELDQRASHLATALVARGVGPEVPVGIAVERSLEMVVGLLAVLKAGGAYVPLDPQYPEQRLSYMLQDSGVRLLLSETAVQPRLPRWAGGEVLLLDQAQAWAPVSEEQAPLPGIAAGNLAYSIYTSGSTGAAKGVSITHGALANYVQAIIQRLPLGAARTMAVVSTIAADLGHTTLFGALCSGSCLHVIDLDTGLDADAFGAYLHTHEIDVLKIVPSHLQALISGDEPARSLPRQCLVLGGEACPAALVRRIATLAPECAVFNHYGPTETTVGALTMAATGLADERAVVPLGLPLANVRARVLDASLQPVAPGTPAELYLGGAGLARGYHQRAALTAERFVPDPFSGDGQRLYRSGDLARYLDGGVIDYLGRIDHQVKIRGYRIELGEITAALKQLPQVEDAVAQVVSVAGESQVAAYVVLAKAQEPEAAWQAIRRQLALALPDYMLPMHFLALDGMPLTPNGKLDLRALPPLQQQAPVEAFVAPVSELQQGIAAIWQAVLKVERVGLGDNFFALGGHSLLATQIMSRVRRLLAADVPLRLLFETSRLDEFVEQVQACASAAALPQIEALERDGPLPASHAQQRQWLFWQMHPRSTAYHTPIVVRLQGELDQAALQQTFDALAQRHEAFRTNFTQHQERLCQVVHAQGAISVAWERLTPGLPREAVQARALEETQQLFDLERGPLCRARVLEIAEQDYLLVVTLHHIISDGASMSVLAREFVALYRGLIQGQAPQFEPLSVQYADYANWHRSWLEQGEQQRQLDYWRQQLGLEHPVLELPLDHPRQALVTHRQERMGLRLPADLEQGLRRVAREHDMTLFQLFLGSFALLLHRYSDQPDIRIGVPVSNRRHQEMEGVMGFFVNTLVMRVELAPSLPVGQLLRQVKATALAAQAHQDLPFDRLVDALKPQRALDQNPLFQVMYNHLSIAGESTDGTSLPGLQAEEMVLQGGTAQFDLTLETLETDAGINASLIYAGELFEVATVERLADHWRNLLQGLLEPQRALGELPMLGQDEQRRIRQDWDHTDVLYPTQRFVHQLFADQAAKAPDAPAVFFAEQRLSYRELDTQANQLAHKLIELGVGPEVRVAIAMPRCAEIMVAFLAVLKAGGVYVPLDIEYPQDRLRYMMQDSGAWLLLTQSHLLDRLPIPEGLPTLSVEGAADFAAYPVISPQVELAEENLAYVIYTSGSTGLPKGVAVSHGPLAMHSLATGERYEMSPADCELHFMSFAFDGSHEGWMHPLIYGASVLIRDDSLWSPEFTYEQMHRYGVTVGVFPPVYLQQLAVHAERDGNPPAVRVYCFGGDAVPQASYDLAWRVLRPKYIFNGYGPTETVVTPLIWKAKAGDPCDAAYAPIGNIVGNRSAYVADANLNLLPVGVAGELYLGGLGVARGYLDRPGLTAERFIPDPYSTTGARLYRSGDLTRYRTDGLVEYVGRVDHQVKVRGFRIELGEIEARLLEQDPVLEVAVIAQPGPSGQQLVGYIVPVDAEVALSNERQAPLRESIKARLRESLPDYMVPTYLLFLEALPLTPNGKLDRKSLPKVDAQLMQQTYVAPQNDLEQQIAAIWADVLKLEQVGVTDNFFELGGDSIISIQVVSRARQAGIRFTPKDLFQHQTVQGLATVAEQGEGGLQIDQGPVRGQMPLLPIQQWFFDTPVPERHHWNQSVLLKPLKPLSAQALQQGLQALLEHHDGLRLKFVEEGPAWIATYAPQGQVTAAPLAAMQADALLWLADDATEDSLQALCDTAQRSLDLQQGPLLRAVLFTLRDGTQRLLLAIHHLVVDGVSWRVLLEDLHQALVQQAAGQVIKLPAKTSSSQAWAGQLQAYANSAALQQELGYWQAQLQGVESDLPGDRTTDQAVIEDALSVSTELDPSYTQRLLQDAPAAYRTQINDLLLTALARVITRWTGESSALVQLEGHGREELFDSIDLSRTLGWFTSVFPVKLTPQPALADSIKHIKEQLRAVPNKGIGYGALRYLGDASAQATLAALAVPRITFNYLGQFDGSFDEPDAWFAPSAEAKGADQHALAPLGNWLSINGQVYGGQLKLGWTFSQAMFDTATIQHLADDYARELKALIEHCSQPEQRGATPSDFPLAGLSQQQLDQLPLALAEVEDLYPLSPMQQGMLFHTLYEQGAGDYINQLRVDVDGLDPERFRQAWQAAIDSHDILRSGFLWQGELPAPIQVVHKRIRLDFVEHDWRTNEAVPAALDGLAEEERLRGFDLLAAPLLRLTLVRTGEQRYHLIYTNHHILMDGWSNSRLLGEVLQRYAGQFASHAPGRYRDYIAWLQRQDAQLSETFWKQQLADLDEPTRLAQAIGRGGQAPAGQGYAAHQQHLDLQQTQRLSEFARQQKVTVNTLVQAAWLLLLQRYTGQDSVVFGATVSGRPAELKGVEQQIGLFINTLPVVAAPRPDMPVSDWLQVVQERNLALRDFEHTPLYDVQRWAGLGGEALFDNILVFENYPVSEALAQGAPAQLSFGLAANHEQTNYPLTLSVYLGQTLAFDYSYALEHFAEANIRQLAGYLEQVLMALVEQPQSSIGELALTGATERRLIEEQRSRTPARDLSPLCVQQLIEAQAERTPDAVALLCAGEQLSYGQFNQQANQLAHKLIERGVGPDVRVGIAVERGLDMIVGLLAVLKAGGAYVPLDPEYPQERLHYMMQDSGIELLLTQTPLLERLRDGVEVPHLCLDQQDLDDYARSNPQPRAQGANLAYVMYTSGSTGRPKGVDISHSALSQHAQVSRDYFSMSAADRGLQFSTFNFDAFVEQLYPALICGASVVIRGKELWDSETFYRELIEQGISIVDLSTAYWFMLGKDFAAREPRDFGRLRQLNLGGEAMPAEGVAAWKKAGLRHACLLNTYGPTEATVSVTAHDCSRYLQDGQALPSQMPLGKGLPGRSIYLLDTSGNLTLSGATGELMIGGELLARGYHNRPGLTAERFIPDPFSRDGGRLYRSGDLARYDAQGVIEYAGRIDHQVKIRGFRIEMGEIEARLLELPLVREAVVLAQEAAGGPQLVAYVVAAAGVAAESPEQQSQLREQLKAALKQALPDYMLPAHLLFLAALPLSPNGKLDRKVLPKADASLLQQAYIAPQSELEQQVAAIWAQVLEVEQVGMNDNFFELGGHSLLVTAMVSRVQLKLGRQVSVHMAFEFPSLGLFVSQLQMTPGQVQDADLSALELLLDEMEAV
ncbi:non-ribosomal peptide synthetase [Pseudomonas sp. TKO26]|uniref:non-ribosomal peptide synthetase n=1 Tax=unclassified Pseudomonas TaxID=196821 RepID=UPI000D9CD15A|nr:MULTISPECIES: non-ribosomal peptide synthetase [unclassified Pseudomonas]PYY78120.1 non-ribosomal peptide synthetase [Pseudomonas sp. TKO30]PYY78623.1 non-ribosomal peptide synthetase [Pseudomonas sp. TKO29]PYY80526.1 non-ribosomal peptide synthetase [Pseudomonas sp. TKO26]PYY95406.1 non-ribosomal peptide synthetase [Pseudomonas sp. TKO14]